jgi:membrane associated rhomboid family serine protease
MRAASVGFHCPDDVEEGARTVRAPRTRVGALIRESPPVATGTLIVLNIAAYLVTGFQAPGTLHNPVVSRLFIDWQLLPQDVHSGRYYELLTSGFLHLSLLHIGANMLTLAIIGPFLEAQLGWARFLAVYTISLVGGSAAVYAFGFFLTPTAGASGAIFGLFGVALALMRKLGIDRQWLAATLVLNFVVTFSVPDISRWGHIGGFVSGLLCGVALGGLPRVSERVPTRTQLVGLAGVLALVIAVVAIRTATW